MDMKFNTVTSSILKALISGSDEVSALNGGKFLTTRVSNHICLIRQSGIEVDTQRVKANSGKSYGVYKLVPGEANLNRAAGLVRTYTKHSEVNRKD